MNHKHNCPMGNLDPSGHLCNKACEKNHPCTCNNKSADELDAQLVVTQPEYCEHGVDLAIAVCHRCDGSAEERAITTFMGVNVKKLTEQDMQAMHDYCTAEVREARVDELKKYREETGVGYFEDKEYLENRIKALTKSNQEKE